MIPFTYNDGGRSKSSINRSKSAGDCVCRAIAIITGKPYDEVWEILAQGNQHQAITKSSRKVAAGKYTADRGISVKRTWFKKLMKELGFEWVSVMGIGTGCKMHLREGEVPSTGKIIASVSKHCCAVIDGTVHDTYDPSRGGTRMVYGYYRYKHSDT